MNEEKLLQIIEQAAREGATLLDLSGKDLVTLPPEIGQLTVLGWLDLSGNRLTALPPEIGQLTGLIKLDLDENQLTALPPEIGQLASLEELHLDENQLTALPPEIGQLTNLRDLLLSGNQLTALPPEIGQLASLEELHLDENQLTALPPEIGRLTYLWDLNLDDNARLISPPPEIVWQGTEAILIYLRERLESSSRQWVSKLLVVGQGGVGKTSMLRALRGEEFNRGEDPTHGIEIRSLELDHPEEAGVTMRLNAWDFGGQEIQHATHQFFLTNRSLFLLAWNVRHGFEQGKLHYWLDTIQALAPDSPVLLVATHIDQGDADIPLGELRREYPQIIGQCEISNETRYGIDALRSMITTAATGLPLMGEAWPTAWLDAANAVRSRPKKHMTPRQLWYLMAFHGVEGDSAMVLASWLHELGEILYFHDNDELNDIVILKPQWVSQYISEVLNSEEVIEKSGIFTREHMDALWRDLDPTMRNHFLNLMECFDLSYRTLDNKEISLVVERLPLDQPDYERMWDAPKATGDYNEIAMKFDLNTIPAGIPTWFIARQHRFTTGTHWRNGALFADESERKHLALVRSLPHQAYLELIVRGPNPHNFFALLKDGIEVTLARFPGLRITRLIPCPGHNGEPCSHEFDYEHLLKRVNKKPTIECPESLEDISVTSLLFGLHWTTQDAVLLRLDDLKTASVEQHKEVLGEIKNLRELAQREFTNAFHREQAKIESWCPNVFALRPHDIEGWRKFLRGMNRSFVGQRMDLQLYCQAPGHWHPTVEGGLYQIDEPAKWIRATAPYLLRLGKIMKYTMPLVSPFLGVAVPTDYETHFKNDIALMNELAQLAKKLPDPRANPELDLTETLGEAATVERAEGTALRALRLLLDEKDPQQQWGGLQRVLTPEGHYLWLCDYHASGYRV